MRSLVLVLALVVAVGSLAGCSDDDDGDGGNAGSGGSAGSGGQAGSAGASGQGGSAGSAGSGAGAAGSAGGEQAGGGQGGSAGAPACPDPSNPMFGSCADTLLTGCYGPDLKGTCSSTDGNTVWSDGSKYITKGDKPGLYGPGDADPCIKVEQGQGPGSIVATKGTDKLTYATDSTTETATITCPDGSTFTAKFDQVTAFNRCRGVNCPTP